jgi:pilus assembly protein CpaF
MAALNNLVTEAIDLVVHCARSGDRVLITEIVAVEDLQGGASSVNLTTTPLFRRARPDEPLRWTGNLPSRAASALEAARDDDAAQLRHRVGGEV